MKTEKKLLAFLLISSCLGYLEWGDQHQFLAEMEWEVLTKAWDDPISALHPFTIIPLVGQLLLFWALFQRKSHYPLQYVAIASLFLLLGFMSFIGFMSLNMRVLVSTFPFLLGVGLYVKHRLKNKKSRRK
ncbi:MAG: hypothetical protein CFE24_11385 [Flavobacterium sp. BFFFF2]|nr:MAG: hypothetical protein CFE24_11385 [Flavobacterium sp. BFFFF2]